MPSTSKRTQKLADIHYITLRLWPFRGMERVGTRIEVRFLRLIYDYEHVTMSAEARGVTVQDNGLRSTKQRLVSFPEGDFPDWVGNLAWKHMPETYRRLRIDRLNQRRARADAVG
jgi:hypothetical protein